MVKNLNQIDTKGRNSKKANPFANDSKEIASKSMRVYEKDYDTIKEMAYKDKMKMVEIVEEAIQKLYESRKYDK